MRKPPNRHLLAFLAAVVLACGFVAECLAAERAVLVIAHRGANKFAPENTLPAIEKAIELGADYVEIDIRETKDGQLVLMHNSSVDARTNGKGEVSEMTLGEFKSLDAGLKFGEAFKGTPPPTFEEALSVMKGKINGYLDFKAGAPEKLVRAVEAQGMEGDVVVYGGMDRLLEIQKLNPKIRIMPGADSAEELNLLTKTGAKIEVVETSILSADKKLVEAAHGKGIAVYMDILGPMDNRLGLKRALALGVDAVQTDNPDAIVPLLDLGGKKTGGPQPASP